jgi:hypothetical protein
MTISIIFFLVALFSVITMFRVDPRVLSATLFDMFDAAAHFADSVAMLESIRDALGYQRS